MEPYELTLLYENNEALNTHVKTQAEDSTCRIKVNRMAIRSRPTLDLI